MDKNSFVTVSTLVDKGYSELVRLNYAYCAVHRHDKQFQEFLTYCEEENILNYDITVGPCYFLHKHGFEITGLDILLNEEQRQTRASIRVLDDIYHFGYARRYGKHHDYRELVAFEKLLKEYLEYCQKHNDAQGTIRVKQTKLQQFFRFIKKRQINISHLTPADISDFIATLSCYSRSTTHIVCSVLSCFLRYLHDTGIISEDISWSVPRPKIYDEENIPKTWETNEVRQLLSSINCTSDIGKRDYAMILMAVMLGMRAGDICSLKFQDFDWKRKLITYTQQKTGKINTLPILPLIGDAIIDYLENGRRESECDNVFIKHISPYDAFRTSASLSASLRRHMAYGGIATEKRKMAHSLRHTLASCLLREGTPLMHISNVLGHDNPDATAGYINPPNKPCHKSSSVFGIFSQKE